MKANNNGYSDPKQIIDQAPMSLLQIAAVGICILLNTLDGFDVLAISFAAPGIAQEWGVGRAALGVVLVMELFGMGVGAISLGGFADRIGRRPTILFCLVLMTLGMYLSALTHSVTEMLVARFVTGLGIGGMLASINTMTAEFSNAKNRHMSIVFMSIGYPLGAIVGGAISSVLLNDYDWRAIFIFGSICSGFMFFVVWFCLPESIEYLSARRPKRALERINRTLKKMGHTSITVLPEIINQRTKNSYSILFSRKYLTLTFLLVLGFFMSFMTFYYLVKWIPKIVVDLGYEASVAGSVLVWTNVGGAIGAITLGLIAKRLGLQKTLIIALVLGFFAVSIFGLEQKSLLSLTVVAFFSGLFLNSSIVAFFALMATSFAAEVRASGTGVVIGIGRSGAALGPIIAGFLFEAGFDLFFVSVLMALGAIVAAVCVFRISIIIK